jgi:hypothetical protein
MATSQRVKNIAKKDLKDKSISANQKKIIKSVLKQPTSKKK